MRLKTQLVIKADIDAQPPRAWIRKDFVAYLKAHRKDWNAPEYLTAGGLISFLLENEIARIAEISSKDYGRKSRYVTGNLSHLQFATSFFKNSYLSHATALHLHGLLPLGEVFVNHEQTPKKTTSRLSQHRIDQAFRNAPRSSSYVFHTNSTTITFLNGKNTGNAGVIEVVGPTGETLRSTSLERTLIDSVVRPQYAGGIPSVLDTARRIRDRISIPEIIRLLKLTRYAYPYHQALGFLLEKAGLSAAQLQPLRQLPLSFKFYLDYAMNEPAYDSDWKLYYPSDLG